MIDTFIPVSKGGLLELEGGALVEGNTVSTLHVLIERLVI